MKTRSWLYASAAVMLGGLAALAFFSVYAIHDIRGIISQLTDRSTPLQIKTTEMQRSIESLTGVLLRLGVATDKAEVAELTSAVNQQLASLKSSIEGIKTLDAAQAGLIDVSAIDSVYADVKKATTGRIESLGNFQEESRKVNESIQSVERSLSGVRRDMHGLTASGAKMVTSSVNSSAQMFTAVQQVKNLIIFLKEFQICVKDIDAAKTGSEILANKSKIKSTNSMIQGINNTDQTVIEAQKAAEEIFQLFVKPETGLIALKQGQLAGKDTGAKIGEEKRSINNRLLELTTSLAVVTAKFEKKADQNRRDVDQSLGSNHLIEGIDAGVTTVAIAVKTLESKVRLLMLSESVKDANSSAAEIRTVFSQIAQSVAAARKDLGQLKQSAALRNIDSANASIRGASASADRIITAQLSIIESNEKAKKAIAMVKTAANRELKSGEELVKNTANVQKLMVERTNTAATRMTATIITMAIVIAVLAALPLVYTIRRITRSLSSVTLMIKDIAEGEGDLSKRLDDSGKDEFAELSRWFNHFLIKLNTTLVRVSSDAGQLTAAATGLLDTSRQIARAADAVSTQGATAATSSEEMAATSADIALNCQTVADNSRKANDAAQSGSAVVREMLDAMTEIALKVRSSAATVGNLGLRGEQIGVIVATIEEIADQTNLLALNAAIEAARAGEQGRGFAVVADEVRRLAERTSEATREIGSMIKAIQDETRVAVRSMEDGVKQVSIGSEKAAGSGEALQEILDQIASLNMQISQIATAAEQQTATTNEINSSVQQMTDEVSTTAQGAKHAAEAASQLSVLAEGLERLMGQFKLAS
jgi:methyl-accepting chemotaxis protein